MAFLPAGTPSRLLLAAIFGAVAGYGLCAPLAMQPLALWPVLEALRSLRMPGWIPLAIAGGIVLVLLVPKRTRVSVLMLLAAVAAFAAVALPLERIRSNRFDSALRAFDQQTVPLISAV